MKKEETTTRATSQKKGGGEIDFTSEEMSHPSEEKRHLFHSGREEDGKEFINEVVSDIQSKIF